MAIKIIRPWEAEPVTQIVTLIYGKPGMGKTTLAFSAADPLLLDFDGGGQRAGNTKDRVAVTQWSDVDQMTADDLAPFSTVIVDTLGTAQEVLMADIIARNPKHGYGNTLTRQGYGELKGRFLRWLKFLKQIGKDVVLIAHASEEQHGDDTVDRIRMAGSAKEDVYASSDAICKVIVDAQGRKLMFDPSEASLGKNPAQLPVATVPDLSELDGYLGGVIQRIKDSMSALDAAAAEQRANAETENQEKVAGLEQRIASVSGNGLLELRTDIIKSGLPKDTQIDLAKKLGERATAIGYAYDKEQKLYVGTAIETPAPAPAPASVEPESDVASSDEGSTNGDVADYDARIAELTKQKVAAGKAKDRPKWLALGKEIQMLKIDRDMAADAEAEEVAA